MSVPLSEYDHRRIHDRGFFPETRRCHDGAERRHRGGCHNAIREFHLSDIKAGDYVTIGYYDDASGKKQAQNITVEYSGAGGSQD